MVRALPAGRATSDDPGRLSAAEQRSVGLAYVAGAARLFIHDATEFLPLYDGSAARVESTGDAVVLSHAIGGGRELRKPGIDTRLAPATSAETQLCSGAYSYRSPGPDLCGRFSDGSWSMPHWPERDEFAPKRRAFEMSWSAPGQTGGLSLDEPLDLSTRRLELRTIVDPAVGDVSLRARLVDAAGAAAVLTPEGGSDLAALPGNLWAQALVVDPAAATTLDLTRIVGIGLVGESQSGRIWVLDVAAAPPDSPRCQHDASRWSASVRST